MRRVWTLRIPLGPIRISVRTAASVERDPRRLTPPTPTLRDRLAAMWSTRSRRRRTALAALGVLAAAGVVSIALATRDSAATGLAWRASPPELGRGATFSPVVSFTGRPPTGYAVTFRYRGPRARLVQVEGDWYFSGPNLTTVEQSEGLPPSEWKPGDFAVDPNQFADVNAGVKLTWPVDNMKRDAADGVWSYTTPLPSGVFDYEFVVNCTHPELTTAQLADPNVPASFTGCPEIADPRNPPWNDRDGVTHGSSVTYSQVYVPSDPTFRTVGYWWEAPTSPRGALTDITYRGTDGPPATPGENRLAVYTPPGYDPHRRKPYPTLYLSHGYDNNEIDWAAGGDAANILDNLIDKHEIAPMVVVMPNAYWLAPPRPTRRGATAYDRNLLGVIIPYVQSHYNVSQKPSERAFAGLSYGGFVASTLLLDHTHGFAYYGLFSPAPFSMPAPNAGTGRRNQACRSHGRSRAGRWRRGLGDRGCCDAEARRGSGDERLRERGARLARLARPTARFPDPSGVQVVARLTRLRSTIRRWFTGRGPSGDTSTHSPLRL